MSIIHEPALFDAAAGRLKGEGVSRSTRTIRELPGVFAAEEERASLDPTLPVYEVEMHDRCGEVEGGLYFGVSHVHPGKVGNEFFMTKGHFHQKRDRGEYYWGIEGNGLLLLMDEARHSWAERVFPGSLHYIAGHVAHRLINTGDVKMIVGACWPSDAGHDYEAILNEGFSVRVVEQDGSPVLLEARS
ncbi:glucose-6-phosphate isomerase family protein [Paenibacillus hodogayensis]|uniref:glucose-6-phosphate isomerase n=1 Tax=Paenibacillus hodogayensis TaxID=279208 RepID=A0ABV5VXZ7_9BACL